MLRHQVRLLRLHVDLASFATDIIISLRLPLAQRVRRHLQLVITITRALVPSLALLGDFLQPRPVASTLHCSVHAPYNLRWRRHLAADETLALTSLFLRSVHLASVNIASEHLHQHGLASRLARVALGGFRHMQLVHRFVEALSAAGGQHRLQLRACRG